MSEQTRTKPSGQSILEAVSAHLTALRSCITEPTRIREEDLASKLGVSRTPVREALIRLDSTGLISLRPGKGALLQPVSDKDYLEWLQLREQLEGFAAREAALNASQRDVDGLRALFAPFLKPGAAEAQPEAYAQANVRFHARIIGLADNQLLEKVWESFGHHQTSCRRKTIERLHRAEDSLREHLAIIQAIEDRNAQQAELLARQHVRHLYQAVASARAACGPSD
ncbi:GntR family transcriptional regulator [Vandammella animalimorsus]|uniref:GntR family transcriptional regulator n=1 Tax=Vandammella animalimorsus TaxID=2029117 RepID=A0A2A2APT8_9BURK|nr:GntR family transcriptional regulator [Vandammella animalimorsus]PAT39773.1 GntR family transcriptional regulator [Vandammella animalimorsus]RMX10044.1 GntR family transcriptional regulator [Vandammella animalimorsus]